MARTLNIEINITGTYKKALQSVATELGAIKAAGLAANGQIALNEKLAVEAVRAASREKIAAEKNASNERIAEIRRLEREQERAEKRMLEAQRAADRDKTNETKARAARQAAIDKEYADRRLAYAKNSWSQEGQAARQAANAVEKALSSQKSAFDAYKNLLKEVNTARVNGDNAAVQAAQQFVAKAKAAYIEAANSAKAAAKAASEGNVRESKRMAQAAADAAKEVVKAGKDGAKAIREEGEAARQAANENLKLSESIDKARRSAYALTIAGAQSKMMFSQMKGALGDIISSLSEFDFNVRRAAGASGILDDTSQEFISLTNAAKNLAVETRLFDASTVAKGMYYWASTTGQAADATNELIPVLQLAAMTETQTETAIKGVVNILQQFGNPMSDAKRVTEELFTVTQKTALELPNLIESFKMVGPVAAGFGVTIEEMMKIFGILGDVGVKGSMAGRAMAMMFAQIADPTDKATAALNKYAAAAGMLVNTGNFWDLVWPEGKFIGVQGFLNLLTEMTKNLDEENKQALLAAITTQNEWRALAPLVDANTRSLIESGKGIIDTTDSMSGAATNFAGNWKLIADSVRGSIQVMQTQVENLKMTFGQALMQALKPVIDLVGQVATAMNKWAQENPALMQMVATITLISTALLGMSAALLLSLGYLKLLSSVAVPTLGLMMRVVNPADLAAGVSNLNIFKAVIAKIITHIPQIAALVAIFVTLIGVFSGLATEVGPNVQRLFEALGGLFGRLTGIIMGIIKVLYDFGYAVGKKIAPAVKGLLDIISGIVEGFNSWLDSLAGNKDLQNFASVLSQIIGFLGNEIFGIAAGVFKEISKFAEQAAGWVGQLADFLGLLPKEGGGGGGGIGNPAMDFFNQQQDYERRNKPEPKTVVGAGLLEAGSSGYSYATAGERALESMADNIPIVGLLAEALGGLKVKYDEATTAANENAASAANSATILQTSLTDTFSIIGGLGDSLQQALKDMSSTNKESARLGYDFVRQYAAAGIEAAPKEIPPVVKALFTAAQTAVKSGTAAGRIAGKQITAIIAEGISSGHVEHIFPRITKMMEDIRDKIKSGNPALREQGRDAVLAIAQGLNNSQLLDPATKQIVNMAITKLKSSNPDMWQSGYDWIMKIVNGVAGGYPTLVKAMQAVARTARTYGESVNTILGANEDTGKFSDTPTDTPPAEKLDTGGGGGGGNEKSPLEKALEVAKNSAELVDALTKVRGKDVKKLVQEAMGPLAEAMVLAEKITYKYAKGFSKEHLQKVADFSDAMEKMVGFINNAFDAFSKAKDFKAVSSTVLNKLFDAVQYSVVQMEAIAKKLTGTKGRDSLLAQTAIFAETSSAVVESIGKAFEAFSKVPKDFTEPPKELLAKVSNSIGVAVVEMEKVAKTVNSDLLESAKAFAESAGTVMDAIGKGLDLFSKKFVVHIPTPTDMKNIVAGIRLAVDTLLDEVILFNQKYGMEGEYGEGGKMGALGTFANIAGSIMDAVQKAFDLFQPQQRAEMGPGKKNPLDILPELVGDMVKAIQTANDLFETLNLTMSVSDIEELIGLATGIVDAIQAFMEITATTVQDAAGGGQTLQQLISTNLAKIFDIIAAFTASFEEHGIDIVENMTKGLRNDNAIRELDRALAALQTRITGALSGIGTLTITWSSGATVTASGGLSASAAPSGGGGGGGTGASTSNGSEPWNQQNNQFATGNPGNPGGNTQYWQDDQGNSHWSVEGVEDPIVQVTGSDADGNPTGYQYIDPNTGNVFLTTGAGGSSGSGKAVGGGVYPGNKYVVGEHGPEILELGQTGGIIHPNGGSVWNGTKQGGGLTGGVPKPDVTHQSGVGGDTKVGGGLGLHGGGGIGSFTGIGGSSIGVGGWSSSSPASASNMMTVNVISADGSVSRIDKRELANMISDSLRGNIQHAASVR